MDQTVVIYLVVTLAAFLLLRPIFIWYWKIDVLIGLLREIKNRLPEPDKTGTWVCDYCKRENPPDVTVCPSCGHKLHS